MFSEKFFVLGTGSLFRFVGLIEVREEKFMTGYPPEMGRSLQTALELTLIAPVISAKRRSCLPSAPIGIGTALALDATMPVVRKRFRRRPTLFSQNIECGNQL